MTRGRRCGYHQSVRRPSLLLLIPFGTSLVGSVGCSRQEPTPDVVRSPASASMGVKSDYPDVKPGEWTTYRNARFAYAIDVPKELQVNIATDNADGREYRSADGKTTLLVTGGDTLPGLDGETTRSLRVALMRWKEISDHASSSSATATTDDSFHISFDNSTRTTSVRTIRLPKGFATAELRHTFTKGEAMPPAFAGALQTLRPLKP